jgi:hypothetical protein
VSQKSSSKPSSTANGEIFNRHRLLLPQKTFTKTRSLGPKNHPRSPVVRLTLTSTTPIDYSWQKRGHETESLLSQNSSSKRNSTADADIFNIHRLLLAQKPLTKTRTLGPKKSSMKPSSTADADIFCANRLLLTDKLLTKNESLVSQNSSSNPSSTADAEIFNLHRLLLPQKPLTKTRSLGPKNHPRSPVLRLTLTSSAKINYSWQTNRCWKLSPCCPKIHPRNPVLRLTLKSSIYTD